MSIFNTQVDNPGTQELRRFGFVSAAIVIGLFGLLLPWIFNYGWPVWPWIFAGILATWAAAHADSLFVVYRGWMKFGHVAGWINTRIILSVMFYLVFFPAGMLMMLLRKDPMARKFDHGSASYRKISDPITKDHIERPY